MERGLPGNVTSSVVVRLDTSTVLAVDDNAILEQDVRNIVVGFTSNTTDTQSVATIAVHTAYSDAVSRSHCDTVVLVVDVRVAKDGVGAAGNVEAVRVVCSWKAIRAIIWCITSGVIERNVLNYQACTVSNIEAVDGIVLNVEILDNGVTKQLHNDEMVGSVECQHMNINKDSWARKYLAIPPLDPCPSHQD